MKAANSAQARKLTRGVRATHTAHANRRITTLSNIGPGWVPYHPTARTMRPAARATMGFRVP